jgi:hypothetical protein
MNRRSFLLAALLLPVCGCIHWPGVDNKKRKPETVRVPAWTKVKFSEVKLGERFNGNPSGPYWAKTGEWEIYHMRFGQTHTLLPSRPLWADFEVHVLR